MALTRQQREEQASEARAYVTLMRDRLDAERARGARSTFGLIAEVLRYGVTPQRRHHIPDPISRRMAWCIDVGTAALALGRSSALVLVARLAHRPKASQASWEQIAAMLDETPEPLTALECKRRFPMIVSMFLAELEARGLTRDIASAMGEEAAA